MVISMTDGDPFLTEPDPPEQFMVPRREVIDYGVAALELPAGQEVATEVTEYPDSPAPEPSPEPSLIGRAFGAVLGFFTWTIRSLFGIASLILLLAVIAAIPGLNVLALGYLLEVEGRLARSGKLRDAFPLINLAPRLGSIVLGVWAWVIPLRLLTHAAADARLIDPGSFADVAMHILVYGLSVVLVIHLCLALARGGSLWSFMWPLALPLPLVPVLLVFQPNPAGRALGALLLLGWFVWAGVMIFRTRGIGWIFSPARRLATELKQLATTEYWNRASDAVRTFTTGLRLKHHFLLGLKGWLGAMAWLVIPTALFAATTKTDGGPILITLFGGVLLMIVLSWVPFLQAHFAAENRFGAMFELKKVRALYKNAPFSWTITMLVTLTLALPMYLFKIALPPSDAMWLVTIVFIVSIYPAKVVTGWAYHRAVAREKRAHWSLRWLTRLVLVPLLAMYVFLLFFTQFIGEHGKGVLFEHHAFLLPAPF